MKPGLLYIHGKNGSISEAERFKPLFSEYYVAGFDYHSETPWDAVREFSDYFDSFYKDHNQIMLVANSIGAFFAMHALKDKKISKALFISPIVNMEALILDMMKLSEITESELESKREITTDFVEKLSWEYLQWVRNNPVSWTVPTSILYGSKDHLQSLKTIKEFADKTHSNLTILDGGEHWFHTFEQLAFLDQWAKKVKSH